MSSDDAIPVEELLTTGKCTPKCLLALNDDKANECCCRCGGRYHGALVGCYVTPGESNNWWLDEEVIRLDADEYVDMRNGSEDYYRARSMSYGRFGAVLRFKDSYSVEFDHESHHPCGDPYDADKLYDLLLALVAARRITAFCAPQGDDFRHADEDTRYRLINYFVEGIRSFDEAKVIHDAILNFIYTPYVDAWLDQTKRLIAYGERRDIDMSLIDGRIRATKSKWDSIHACTKPSRVFKLMSLMSVPREAPQKSKRVGKIITISNFKEVIHE